jgi:hypothetical protein
MTQSFRGGSLPSNRFDAPGQESGSDNGYAVTRFDETVMNAFSATGRRSALRTAGAVALALVTAQGLEGVVSAAQGNDVAAEGGDSGRRGRKGKKGKKGRKGQKGAQGSQGPQGPQGPAGPVTSVVVQGNIAALPVPSTVIGAEATSTATCAANSVLLGCGYELSTSGGGPTPAGALNNAIADVVPNSNTRTCTATLVRTDLISGQITAAAQIRAYAVCRA